MTRNRFFRFGEALSWQQQFFYSGLSTLVILALWWSASVSGLFDSKLLPSPLATAQALADLLFSGEFFYHAGISMARIAVGFAVAGTVGLLLGSLAGAFARVDALLTPLHSALRYIPPTAFIGLTILWFGIGETNKVALIFLGLIFFVIQMSRDAVRLVPRMHVQAALTLGANRWEIFTRVMLRSALPDLLAVLRVNLGAAWTFLVVAEIVGAQAGLGYLMALSQRFLQTQKLFALILIVGALGFASDALFARLIRYFSKGRELHGAH